VKLEARRWVGRRSRELRDAPEHTIVDGPHRSAGCRHDRRTMPRDRWRAHAALRIADPLKFLLRKPTVEHLYGARRLHRAARHRLEHGASQVERSLVQVARRMSFAASTASTERASSRRPMAPPTGCVRRKRCRPTLSAQCRADRAHRLAERAPPRTSESSPWDHGHVEQHVR
jgi:hypothetical protein